MKIRAVPKLFKVDIKIRTQSIMSISGQSKMEGARVFVVLDILLKRNCKLKSVKKAVFTSD